MSAIDKIMGAVGRHGDDCIRDADSASESFEALREMIAAALADARRDGAEQMRAAVESALDDLPLPDGFFVSDIMGAINDAMPLPTGERQAVLLTDEQIEHGREKVFSTGNPFCPCDAKTMRKAARWADRAVLAANGLEVRRG